MGKGKQRKRKETTTHCLAWNIVPNRKMSHSLEIDSCTRRDVGDSNSSDNSKMLSTIGSSSRAAHSSSNEVAQAVISRRSESDNSTSDSNQDDSDNHFMFARVKQEKEVKTSMPMNSDGDDEEDVLFFNFFNGKASSAEETEKEEKDVGNDGLANDEETDNNRFSLVLGACASTSPQRISKTADSDSSSSSGSNQSSNDSDGTTNDEKPSNENTVVLHFSGLKINNIDNIDSSGSDSDSGSHNGSNDDNDGIFSTDLVEARNSGHGDSSDSDCDSECSSKISNNFEHKELREKTGFGSTNCLDNDVPARNSDQGTDGSDHDSSVDDNADAMKAVSKNESSKESDVTSMDDPEALFANISKGTERIENNHPKSDSGDSPKVQESKKSDGGSADDPEALFPNSLISNHSKSDSHNSSKLQSSISGKDKPIANNEEFVVPTAEFQQPIVKVESTPGGSDKQYRSNDSEEERILLLHEEMRKIGLTPTIMVHWDDATQTSGRTSLGEDSYLEDLLQQREEREDEHREEILEETLEWFNAIRQPKSEGQFLDLLDKVKKQKEAEFAKRDVLQDKFISNEVNLRKERLNGKPSSGNPPKEQEQDITQDYPEASQSLPVKTPKPDDEHATRSIREQKAKDEDTKTPKPDQQETGSMREQKKNDKGTTSAKNNLADQSALKRKGEKEATKRAPARRNNGIESARKNKAVIPEVAQSVHDIIPKAPASSSSSSSSSLSSSSSSEHTELSMNGFEDEYYYDEERAMMDRESIRVLEQEFHLSQQESNLTRKMIFASTGLCCLAFVLLLLLILDPLDRRSLLDKSYKVRYTN